MRLKPVLGVFGAVLAASSLLSCGDNSKACGEGTDDEDGDGFCEATGGGLACGPGTVPSTDGTQCVPDGSVICGDGTVFDPATGDCVPDPSVCGPGTVLVDGMCIDEGIVPVDAEEGAEPNDLGANDPPTIAGEILVPAIGEPGFVIHGCVNPYRDVDPVDGNPDIDFDAWLVSVSAPTALEITADGVGGLAAGFVAVSGDPVLGGAGWQRFGVNLVNDMSKRQLFLPVAGDYIVFMTDSRSLFLDAAGGPDACYYTTVTQIALPAATPGTITDTPGTDNGNLRVISFDPAEGDLYDQILAETSSAFSSSFVVMVNDTFAALATDNDIDGAPAFHAGYAATDTIEIVVDSTFNFALQPQDYVLVTLQIGAQALPTDGSNVTITPSGAAAFTGDLRDLNWLYFDIAPGDELTHWNMTFSAPSNLSIVDSGTFFIADVSFPGDPTVSNFVDEFVKFAAPGRYYVVVFRAGEPPANTWTLTNTLTSITPTAIADGTPGAGDLGIGDASFHTFDPAAEVWLAFTGSGTDLGAANNLRARYYDVTGSGWLDVNYVAISALTQTFLPAGQTRGRIVLGDTRDFLVRLESTGTPGANPTYSLALADRVIEDEGTLVSGTPINDAGIALPSLGSALAFVRVTAGDVVTINVDPSALINTTFELLNTEEGRLTPPGLINNGALIDQVDSVVVGAPTSGWIALRINNLTAVDGTFDLNMTAVSPRPYVITSGTLPFTEICPANGGAGVELAQDTTGVPFGLVGDEALTAIQTLPFSFELFGEAAPNFYVSTNGYISFGPFIANAFFSNTGIPNTANPNGILAAYWDDIENTPICRFDTATTVTIQWEGNIFFTTTTVKFQMVLHDTGVIDYIYGASHAANGSGGTVGAETLLGTFGHQIVFNMAGVILPGTSRTLTPM
jgi:hypothetical protein